MYSSESLILQDLLKKLNVKCILLISNRNVTVKPFIYGEDFYISNIISEIKKFSFPIHIVVFRESKIITSIENIVNEHTAILLHNVSPYYALKSKLRGKAKLIMPIYFLWNKCSSIIDNFRTNIGVLFWQPFIDAYLVPSNNIAISLRKRGVIKPIITLPPKYVCPFCNYKDNMMKKKMLKIQLPKTVKAVYIGSMNPKRLPLSKIVGTFNKDLEREYKLSIFTTSNVKAENYLIKNVEVNVFRKILSDEEKCKILRDSHVFIAPAKNTTMEPSISVIEAEYHGNIILDLVKVKG